MTPTIRLARWFVVGVLTIAACVTLPGFAQAVVIIDDFNTGSFTSPPVLLGGDVTFNQTGSGILGGDRDVRVQVMGIAGASTTVSVNTNFPGEFEADPNIRADNIITLTFNGAGSGFADTDFTAMQAIGLAIVVTGNITPFQGTITLNDGTNSDSSTQTFPSVTAGGTATVFFPFGDFSGVNLTSINSVVVSLDPSLANDFSFDIIQAVPAPEPLSLGLGAIGVVGLFAAHRRGRKHKV